MHFNWEKLLEKKLAANDHIDRIFKVFEKKMTSKDCLPVTFCIFAKKGKLNEKVLLLRFFLFFNVYFKRLEPEAEYGQQGVSV